MGIGDHIPAEAEGAQLAQAAEKGVPFCEACEQARRQQMVTPAEGLATAQKQKQKEAAEAEAEEQAAAQAKDQEAIQEAQAAGLETAAESGVPFCEECARLAAAASASAATQATQTKPAQGADGDPKGRR
jgi:hypothetical protein